jgi:hypothetical protein
MLTKLEGSVMCSSSVRSVHGAPRIWPFVNLTCHPKEPPDCCEQEGFPVRARASGFARHADLAPGTLLPSEVPVLQQVSVVPFFGSRHLVERLRQSNRRGHPRGFFGSHAGTEGCKGPWHEAGRTSVKGEDRDPLMDAIFNWTGEM